MRNMTSVTWPILSGLGGIAAFLSNPDYYLWAALTIVFIAIAYSQLHLKRSKLILVTSYIGIGIYSFVISRLFFAYHQLTDVGVFMMLLVFPVMGSVVWRIYRSEVAEA